MSEFKHKHSLGQNLFIMVWLFPTKNFLKDKKVLTKIIDSIDVNSNDLIIEVGPGQGALTKFLKLFHAHLRCFEVDTRVKKYLTFYEDEKTKVIYDDFLHVDIENEIKDICYNDLYVIANLPYYITTPILSKMINSSLDVKAMVLMVQNEVANRLSAKVGTKDYGAITVFLNYYYDVEKLFFANIEFGGYQEYYYLKDEKFFFQLIKESFRMKRKNIKNNLKNYDLDIVLKVLQKYDLDLTVRAESISLECFVEMANTFCK